MKYSKEQHDAWFKGLESRVSSAGILLENENGELLIVKANYKDYWTLPGGVIDAGEMPLQAAIREVREEVGVSVDPAALSFGWIASRRGPVEFTYQFVFKALLPRDSTVVLQESEIDEYAFVSKAEVLSGNREYAQALQNWANNASGYVEQTFGL